MNKNELVAAVAEKAGMTKKNTEKLLNVMTEVIMDTVASGDKVQLVGFGSFEAKTRAGHIGRNPRTKEAMQIAESTVPNFKAGHVFKEKVTK